ncbi:MAG: pilus assembly protein [Anaerolineales bacterium]|nr:pilus assembly protein [Anaerolineales bacterium]
MFFLPDEQGQGLMEYALILVLVSVVTVGALMLIASAANAEFSRLGNVLTSHTNP